MPEKYAIVYKAAFAQQQFGPDTAAMQTVFQNLQTVVAGVKQAQTQHRVLIQNTLEASLRAANDDDAKSEAIRQYEKDYDTGVWNDFDALNKAVGDMMTNLPAQPGLTVYGKASVEKPNDRSPKQNQTRDIYIFIETISANASSMAAKLGSRKVVCKALAALVFTGQHRFLVLDPQPARSVNTVLFKRDTGKHYVQDRFNRYVRRYQTRCLNSGDRTGIRGGATTLISKDPGGVTTAKEVEKYPARAPRTQVPVSFEDAVFFHLQQGSKRFISMSQTKHAIYGNTGTSFYTRDYGLVSVDLAYVPKQTIVDVHNPQAAMAILGATPADVKSAMSGQDTRDEVKKAVRDVIRTREVLVLDNIPIEAIHDFGAAQDANYPVNAALGHW